MHTKKSIAIVVALVMLLLLPSAFAVPERTTLIAQNINTGLLITAPLYEYLKTNQTFTFNWHIFNQSDGNPILKNVSCVFHLYNQTGNHIFIQDPISTFEHGNDMNVDVAEGNFTKGFYNIIIQCNISLPAGKAESVSGGVVKEAFEVTNTGYPNPGDNLIIFFMLALIATIIATIYLLIYTIQKYATLDVDYIDFGKNLIAYCVFLILYAFNNWYMGNEMIESVLKIFIVAGVFINIIIPGILLYSCYLIHVIKSQGGGNQ